MAGTSPIPTRIQIIACYFLLLFSISQSAQAQSTESGLPQINLIFDNMEAQGVDTHQPLLYSYFFYDNDSLKLVSFAAKTKPLRYKIAGIQKNGTEYRLQLDRTEIHTRQSIFELGFELSLSATKNGVDSYDGFEVGNADEHKPLISTETLKAYLSSLKREEMYHAAIRLYDLRITDQAFVAFQECINRNIHSDSASLKQGNILLLKENKPEEALAKYEDAGRFNPGYADAFYRIGAVCYDLQQFEKSEQNYRKAVAVNAADDRSWYGIAADEYALGNYAASKNDCRKALELNKENENAQILLSLLKSK